MNTGEVTQAMESVVDLRVNDESYLEYQAKVRTRWGSTFLRTDTDRDFITALTAILPRDSAVHIIRGDLEPMSIIDALRAKRYTVFVALLPTKEMENEDAANEGH